MMTTEIGEAKRPALWGRVILMALVLFVAVGTGLGCDADRTDAVRLYNEALVEFQSGSTGSAIDLLEQSLETDPTFYQAAYILGQLQQQQLRNPEEAAENFRRALDQEPDNPLFNYRLASALAESGEYEDAIDYFEEAIALEPEDARYWFEKGMSQEAVGEFMDAVDSYMKAIELQPRLRMAEHDPGGEHYHSLGDLYYRFRLYNEALQVFENGAENNQANARLYHGLGLAAMELERYEDAVEAFEKALERDPEHQAANFSIAEAYRESGDIDNAIVQLESLVEQGGSVLEPAQETAAEQILSELRAEKEE